MRAKLATQNGSEPLRFECSDKIMQLTHSRVTESMYQRELSDRVKEDNEHSETGPEQECPTCSLWKRWAAEQ
jgi:hypothetical protein